MNILKLMKTPHNHARRSFGMLLALALASSTLTAMAAETSEGWIPLFNGRNLDGWTPKFAQHKIGVNHLDTFRVEDGIIKVSYDKYTLFDQQFGHLYTNSPYSHYIIRLEYRITGKVMADAPSWTALNSGVMLHSQSPMSMTVEQLWPVSLEGQFLAEGTTAGRQTGNICTPGTDVEVNGKLTKAHIIDSSGPMPKPDEWVRFEAEVHGHDEIIYRVNGVEVLRYRHPQLDARDPDAQRLMAAGVDSRLSFGHIALQAEGQPVWFRNVELRPLKR
jgi:hypothetical protein